MQWKVEECKSWVGSPTHELFIDMMNFIDWSKKELAYASHETAHRKQGNNFHEREPGYKIPTIENLGATLDQFDTIDFSDNDIRKLDGFPLLKRIKTLFLIIIVLSELEKD
uniref:U2 small nuclear ribonucleoprotein A n=1 Tax=Apis cerana TaxID=7461 RepID=V9ICL0_APICE